MPRALISAPGHHQLVELMLRPFSPPAGMAMVPLDRTLEIAPTPRDSVLDMVLPTLPLPLPLDAPLYPTTEGNGTSALHHHYM
jgi:hypothetical protein